MLPSIAEMPRSWKRRLVFSADAILLMIAPALALALRVGDLFSPGMLTWSAPLLVLLSVLGLVLEPRFGIPNIKLSALDISAVLRIGAFALSLSVIGSVVAILLPIGGPKSVPAIFGVVLFTLMIAWRLMAQALLLGAVGDFRKRVPVAVYGAGAAGMQLIAALARSNEFRVVAVVDDSPGLRGVYISGFQVQAPSVLRELAGTGQIKRIVLAMPSVPRSRQRKIVADFETLPCEVHATASYSDLITAGDILSSVRSVSSDDLLGRNVVDLDVPDVANAYHGRSVLISGAGGSIGSELCRQVLSCGPRRIVLFDVCEYALYTIDRELRPLAGEAGVEMIAALGSVCDRRRVRSVMRENGVEIVLHAAAYKHVPLIEANEIEAVKNNVFGTQTLAEVSGELGVERFILISTDKAVRPTNVMGGTKRLAEVVVQDLQSRSRGTRFAMVRFGNVLGSSGSVIPLFSSQIAAGGPITVTHPEVTRYFMTIPEAARLVLLAGSYATGGELFVLDMGQPVKIMDLARRMVRLSGLTVKDEDNPDGDIEIKVVGLRPGEKLYEELLIDGVMLPTPNPKILRAQEKCPPRSQVATLLAEFRMAAEAGSAEAIRRQIAAWVEGFRGTGERAGALIGFDQAVAHRDVVNAGPVAAQAQAQPRLGTA